MVTEVKAFAAGDGKIFSTALEAAKWDARGMLVALGLFTEGSIKAILDNPEPILEALAEVAKYQPLPPETSLAQHD